MLIFGRVNILFEPLRDKRIQFRITDETFFRIKILSEYRHITMTRLIEQLVDDAWLDQIALPGFDARRYPD